LIPKKAKFFTLESKHLMHLRLHGSYM